MAKNSCPQRLHVKPLDIKLKQTLEYIKKFQLFCVQNIDVDPIFEESIEENDVFEESVEVSANEIASQDERDMFTNEIIEPEDDNGLIYNDPEMKFQIEFPESFEDHYEVEEKVIEETLAPEMIPTGTKYIRFNFVYDGVTYKNDPIFGIYIIDKEISPQEWFSSQQWIGRNKYLGSSGGQTFVVDYYPTLDPSLDIVNESDALEKFSNLKVELEDVFLNNFEFLVQVDTHLLSDQALVEQEMIAFVRDELSVDEDRITMLPITINPSGEEGYLLFNVLYPTDHFEDETTLFVFNEEGYLIHRATAQESDMSGILTQIIEGDTAQHPEFGTVVELFGGHKTYYTFQMTYFHGRLFQINMEVVE